MKQNKGTEKGETKSAPNAQQKETPGQGTNGMSSETLKRKRDHDDKESPPSKKAKIETTPNGTNKCSLVFALFHL